MKPSGGYCNNVRKSRNLNGGRRIVCRSVAQLAVTVITPCPHRSVALERKSETAVVVAAAGDSFNVCQSHHLNRARTVRGRPVPELTIPVITPTPDRAVAPERKAMIGTRRNRHSACKLADCRRNRLQRRRAVSKFAISVITPGPDRATARYCTLWRSPAATPVAPVILSACTREN